MQVRHSGQHLNPYIGEEMTRQPLPNPAKDPHEACKIDFGACLDGCIGLWNSCARKAV